MEPLSRPVTPPQPDQAQYGVGELALFKTYSRESFRHVFGAQTQAFNPLRKIKTWFDTSVDLSDPEALVVYKVAAQDKSGSWVFRQVGMSAQEAATLNLHGEFEYPVYFVAPTHATRGGSTMNPDYLSTLTDAQAMASEIGADGIVDEGITTVFSAEFPPDEPRRMWSVMFRSRAFNVGLLLKTKFAKGVGAPGHWNVQSGEPVWASEVPPVNPAASAAAVAVWEMPCRDLLPNERLQNGLFGPAVVRTDKQAEAELNSGKFLPSDRAMLQRILQAIESRSV